MDLNDKTISDIAHKLGINSNRGISKRDIDILSSKSDAELEREILKIKGMLKSNNISYEQQMALIRSIAPMLDPKQKQRLNRVVEILRK